jgi:hypothetical protein
MRSPQGGKQKVFDDSSVESEEEKAEYYNNKPSGRTRSLMCKHLNKIHKNRQIENTKPVDSTDKSRGVFLNWPIEFLISSARAGATFRNTDPCKESIKVASNFEMAEELKDDKNFVLLNNTIQESLDQDTQNIKTKVLSRLPQCANYFDKSILKVPNVFNTSSESTITDPVTNVTTLKKNSYSANSLFPNPTNSVVMNKSITFPDSENAAFNDYLKDEMKKRGLKFKSLKTWDYAHIGDGNIHCSSHSLNHCRIQK